MQFATDHNDLLKNFQSLLFIYAIWSEGQVTLFVPLVGTFSFFFSRKLFVKAGLVLSACVPYFEGSQLIKNYTNTRVKVI